MEFRGCDFGCNIPGQSGLKADMTIHLLALLLAALPQQPSLQPQQLGLDLTVNIDYSNDKLDGVARLTIGNAGATPIRTIPLLLNRLMLVRKVTDAADRPLRFTADVVRFSDDPKRQVEYAEVTLPAAIAKGGRTELVVHYDGSLVGYVETGSLYVRDHIDSAFTILRTDAYAFPVIGWPEVKRDRALPWSLFTFHAAINVPAGQVVVTGGRRVAERHAGQRVTWEYASADSVPFLNIAIAPYATIAGPRVSAYVFREDSAAASTTVSKAEQALDSLGRWFGPLDKAPSVTLIEIPPGFGSQSSLTAGIIQDARAFRDADQRDQLYHELSHFWNPRDTAHPSPRLNEGFASLLEWWLAQTLDGWNGLDSLLQYRATRLVARAQSDSLVARIPMQSYGATERTGFSYSVGMLLFDALDRCLGREAFNRLWGDYLRKTRNTGGSDQGFAAFAIATTGKPAVRELFDTWFFTTHWVEQLQKGTRVSGC